MRLLKPSSDIWEECVLVVKAGLGIQSSVSCSREREGSCVTCDQSVQDGCRTFPT